MSNEMSIIGWKPYKVKDFFDIHPTKAYNLNNVQLFNEGNNPVLANSRYNNGVGGYSSLETTENGNMITFSDTVDAETIFYQEKPFIGYAHVQGLYEIGIYKGKWSKYSLLFFVIVFRKAAKIKGFDYDIKFRRDIALELDVYLPIDANNEPDWKYMEDYMRNCEEIVHKRIDNLKQIKGNQTSIDFTSWKEFEIQKLFEIKSPAARTIREYCAGEVPYVSSSGINNGIVSFLEQKDGEVLEKGNCITVSPLEGTPAFYQKYDFLGRGGAGSAISILYNENLNEYNSLFICTIIKVSTKKFNYSDAFNSENLKTLKIKLPIKMNADRTAYKDEKKNYSVDGYLPDWKYMEDFMKSIESKSQTRINTLKLL